MAGKSIGGCRGGTNDRLEGQSRLVGGRFVWGSGSRPEKGGVGRRDPQGRTRPSNFALPVVEMMMVVGHRIAKKQAMMVFMISGTAISPWSHGRRSNGVGWSW